MQNTILSHFLSSFPVPPLNPQQLKAVQAVDGPTLLLAVPGSGKTTVLVTRLGYMIQCKNISPEKILTLTYTVAATKDMQERFSRFFGAELGEKVTFRTINSICARIINHYGRQIGKAPYQLESNEKNLLGIITALYQKYEREYPTESDVKEIKTLISFIKNMMLQDDQILELEEECGKHLSSIYRDYNEELRRRKQMDFDDQMVYAYRMLLMSPELLSYFQDMYPYICVDEAQDTSKIQHVIIALLAKKTENLFMVGDEDQSIYGFRAAYPEALLEFEKQHPGAKVLLMEENYRSNANIVSAADSFIQWNKMRHEKHVRPTRNAGTEVKKLSVGSSRNQYSELLKVAKDCSEQTAVLYRNNESAIALVDILERENVPYRIRNAELSFFTNRVVLDIQNIMRFAMDMKDADLFEHLYYKMSTYLDKQSAMRICETSRANGISIFSAAYRCDGMKPYTYKNMKRLEKNLLAIKKAKPEKAISEILQKLGYADYLKRSGISSNKIYVLSTIASRTTTLTEFINRMGQLQDIIQNKKNDPSCPFILSTIHASKGLEYNNVYIIDTINGIFPESIPEDFKRADKKELARFEEERRMFYVGVTRAKNNLYIFKCIGPSTFVKQFFESTGEVEEPENNPESSYVPTKKKKEAEKKLDKIRKEIYFGTPKKTSREGYKEFVGSLSEGVSVKHSKFGKGEIVAVDGKNATIQFEGARMKLQLEAMYQNKIIEVCAG